MLTPSYSIPLPANTLPPFASGGEKERQREMGPGEGGGGGGKGGGGGFGLPMLGASMAVAEDTAGLEPPDSPQSRVADVALVTHGN